LKDQTGDVLLRGKEGASGLMEFDRPHE
jgi:hypothetical protein